MSEAVVLLANPAAGAGRGRRLLRRVVALLETGGMRVDAMLSRAPGQLAERAAAEARLGRLRVIAVGGDGTISEVAAGLLSEAGVATALGIVPLGTGNDFVRSAQLPRQWRAACRRLLAGCTPRPIDAGRVNGRWFVNGVGVGFDAAIAQATLRHKWLPGPLAYGAGLLAALYDGVAGPVCRLRWDGGEDCRRITLVAACNGQYAGGLFHLAPEAALDDGRLDVLWADALSRSAVLRHAPRVMRGTHGALSITHQARARWLELECESPLPVQADGEMLSEALQRLRIELSPGALTLWS